jgi:hypothetical protein
MKRKKKARRGRRKRRRRKANELDAVEKSKQINNLKSPIQNHDGLSLIVCYLRVAYEGSNTSSGFCVGQKP